MSAFAVSRECSKTSDEWTVVLPRRRKQRRSLLDLNAGELYQGEWAPADVEIDPERELKLVHKLHVCMKTLESSDFCSSFLDQIQSTLIDSFSRVLGSESKMHMVIYGIGSIEAYENPRVQLSLALLMKKRLNWVGDVEVFDPVLSPTESSVIRSLGCSVIPVNEQGKRLATRPTLFFMPHCDLSLYNNLLLTNWCPKMLNHIALLGNSFKIYAELASDFKCQRTTRNGRHVLAARKCADEFEIKIVTADYFRAFNGSSWHFFTIDSEEVLPEPGEACHSN
uniref:SRR1-like domain-containing protein n=1 Tax=Kalanchoe fedtschenkoi TaxID=63787 RepID=A0A7N0TLG3_KALFE